MDFSSSDTVTIDRTYFDTICRRAKFNDAYEEPTALNVVVPRNEYDELSKVARQYANLRQNLINGGVGEETIALLSGDDSTWSLAGDRQNTTSKCPLNAATATSPGVCTEKPVLRNNHPQVAIRRDNHGQFHRSQDASYDDDRDGDDPGHVEWAEADFGVDVGSSPAFGINGSGQTNAMPPHPQYERMSTRSILIQNLPEGTTHADLTAVIRGGQLLDIYLRTHDRSAQVSFVHAADAQRYLDHVRRRDLYIRQKRVEVRWADRQFVLPGHTANKIGQGATRNLIVRRCDGRHTEESIRDDLEHIYNLVVINVRFTGGSCYISTNSVNNAMFARTCMMSRHKYRGSKIEWDSDECAQPLEQPLKLRREPRQAPATGSLNPMANRFHLLGIDDLTDNSSSTESDVEEGEAGQCSSR